MVGFSRSDKNNPNHGRSVLRRAFSFPSIKQLAAFTEHTRIMSVNLIPNLLTRFELLSLDGVTRSMIHLALEIETEYQKMCPDAPVPDMNLRREIQARDFGSRMVLRFHAGKRGVTAKHDISHNDVHFAIELETEFAKNWTGKADNVAALPRTTPTIMDQVWGYASIKE
ncbi:hypothetical protein B0H17DRAFT_1202284 [Mycena rosella]|uniref:Uncharacterized protein n=1 Tax=Mycena rosella TaxID=1033263 RepID=A0AAD7DED8_MYCRO|nr:hypothetical protein B0H17DRAFT_1202284 [Mycena rosella]